MVDAALINGLLSNLVPLIKDEFSLFWRFENEFQKLSSTLSSISALLEDAERKNIREKDKQTEDWLRKLKHVAYEARDIMDECTFEDLRLQVKRRNASSSTRIQVTNFITHPFSNTKMRLKIGHKIKDVQEKLDQISSERQKLHLRESIHDSKIDKFTSNWRETMSLSSSKVYGRDKEKKQIIDILLNNNTSSTINVSKELSVLPIVGIGGLGKTTLAQMVFNDEKVSKHFDPKIWVCVSDEFNIKLVIKSILEEKGEPCLEELQKKKLSGKKYLIVLDDVWNEDEEAWAQLRSVLDCGSNGAFILTTTRKRNVARIMKTITHFELLSLSDDDCWLLFEQRSFMPETPKPPKLIDIGKEIAKKCKGVPLVAKTLASQLGFTSDEKEWRRIRDSEIWEISQNEKSILSILRLSYYDLSYHLRRCFVFCAVFPKDTVIEKERLIQLWMAHGLIPAVKNQEVEDVGNTIWKELCWRSFFQDEKSDRYEIYETCKMHDLMHDLTQSVMKDECYMMNANSSSDGLGRKIRHLTVLVDKLFKTSVRSFKETGGLQSIILIGKYYDPCVTKEIFSVGKGFPYLRVLELKGHVQYEYLSYGKCLKHLKYLDISNSWITTLPNSICNLLNLQTLKLNNCSELQSLPRNMRDLINLRHLYLEDCDGLKYMPRGMGQLKHLKTLSLFVIGNKKRDGQLDEIKELDIRGTLKIKNLERVSDASITRGISMAKKSNINELELIWHYEYDDNQTKSNRHEKIGEALEVSTESLKKLRMSGYKGVNPPKWVGMSSPFPFPLLEELTIGNMGNLRELVSLSPGAFPNLCKLNISSCPNLGALPPHLAALKQVRVFGECSDELLHSISNLSVLTHLYVDYINKRSVLFPSSSTLADNNNEAQLGVRSTFQTLQCLHIVHCRKLRRLFDEGMKETLKISGCENQQGLMNSLTELRILNCPELMISVEEFENFNINNSLQRLWITDCPKLVSSEEVDDVMTLLRSLRTRLGREKFTVDILLDVKEEEQSIVAI
ncbi:putative disease resistance protein RGA3 isoform X1 [Impatiens glandulifera]|uniref:putative disease resistance protein RGA3 isoform X1 n=1 Tax=Impatiens glandulifera TaxID=253017 RepID=UPI001FB14939|nr:putative disease resistance protein RGA3 isoform X1 [Impatiens glandulifera]XP_047337369.1 putative disease resistance protein RGA3 isoform X1 [Impatiens glandulifera]